MEFECNLGTVRVNPQSWARVREAEGWDVISVADHYWTEIGWGPHCFAALGAIAATTTRAMLASGFANNLFRHPVEFAQAALTLDDISAGRFEAGLGAGWSGDELERTGQALPAPAERAERLIEAVEITRRVFDGEPFQFEGHHFRVDFEGRDHPGATAPKLVASVGGPRTLRGVLPYVDRLELKASSPATRAGRLDVARLAAITHDDLRRLVEEVRSRRPELPLGLFVLCRARRDDKTRAFAAQFPAESLFGRFWGEPEPVLDALDSLEEQGISRVHVSASDEGTYEELGALLSARRVGSRT